MILWKLYSITDVFLGKFPKILRKMFRKTSLVISPKEIIICNENFKNLAEEKLEFSNTLLLKEKVYQYHTELWNFELLKVLQNKGFCVDYGDIYFLNLYFMTKTEDEWIWCNQVEFGHINVLARTPDTDNTFIITLMKIEKSATSINAYL